MKKFDDAYKAALETFYEPNSIFMRILKLKLNEINIKLTKKQQKLLSDQFELGKINVTITDKQIKKSGLTEAYIQEVLNNFFKDIDQYIDKYGSSMEQIVENITIEMSDDYSNTLFDTLWKTLNKAQKDRNRIHKKFIKDSYSHWKRSFDLLDVTIYVIRDIIESYNFESEVENTPKNLLLIKFMSKGCLILSEIICLIKNGFPDGAYARWRSLHEITVLSEFLSEQNEEIIIKFIDHQHIQDYKHAVKLKNTINIFQYEIKENEFEIIENNYNEMIKKYGRKFANDYGWAYDLFDKKRIYFSDIESSVDFEYVRSHYKMSSDMIHTNSRGLFNYLGLIENYDFDLLIGPSIIGLEIPIALSSTSASLLFTNILLKVNDEVIMDDLIFLKLLIKIREEIISFCFKEGDSLYDKMQF